MISIVTYITVVLAVMAYSPSNSGVIFNHAAHVGERSIECKTCHDVAASASSADRNIPGHTDCSDCHSTEKAPDDCKLCHTNPENPSGVALPVWEIIFPHNRHLKENSDNSTCLSCHTGVDKAGAQLTELNYPSMDRCFDCHNGQAQSAECKVCHSNPADMTLQVHPTDWKHSHKFEANSSKKDCSPCHQSETFCSECHAGENLVGNVHDLNYRFNHGLDAKAKEIECQSCHDYQTFCVTCHNEEGNMPLNHAASNWSPRRDPSTHASAARQDIETCAGCHDESSFTCGQPGCHRDGDGIQGNNPSIHSSSITDLGHGPWHDDPNFQCYQCHISTGRPGVGFCGYCHGEQGD